MTRPIAYLAVDGVRVPSVTSIIRHVDADNEGLLRWAWKCGQQGITLEDARKTAANVGTIAHAAIEADIKGEPCDLSALDPETLAKVTSAVDAWRLWCASSGYEGSVASELSLVSELHRYGGTLDAVLSVRGERTLIDFKTGGALYGKELAQIAAYGALWNEHHPDHPIARYSLLRLDRDSAGFTWRHMHAVSMEPAWTAFLRARELYDLSKTLKNIVG